MRSVIIAMVILVGLTVSLLLNFDTDESAIRRDKKVFALCTGYEVDGSIPLGSCDCAMILFPDFSDSYDWIDSCEIIKSRNKTILVI